MNPSLTLGEGVQPQVRDLFAQVQTEVNANATKKHRVVVPIAAALTADATAEVPVFYASVAVTVTGAFLVPLTAIAGADTNSMTAHLVNKGTDGAGATDLASLAFVAGTDAAAMAAKSLGAVTGGTLAVGSVLAYRREKVGAGLAAPAMLLVIEYTV